MAHPQNSPRGLFSKKAITIAGTTFDASSITFNSTGAKFVGGIYASNSTAKILTANSTTFISSGGLAVSGQAAKGLLTANSTALILPNSVRVGSLASYISANSTGIKIGTRYISTNTTGNATT